MWQSSTGRWQPHVPATAPPFVTNSHQSLQLSAKGGFAPKLGDSHGGKTLSPCSVTGTKHTQPAGISDGLDFQLVEDDSPVGLGELTQAGELVCSLSLSFTFSHIHPLYL